MPPIRGVYRLTVEQLQASAAMAAAAAQQGGFPGQSMGPPSHASPMLPGPTSTGDPAMAQPAGGMGVRPPMGIMPPGSRSPATNPAMQPFVGGAPAPLHNPQEQQQSILAKMQQCMTTSQKLQQALNSSKLAWIDLIFSAKSLAVCCALNAHFHLTYSVCLSGSGPI